MAWKRRGPEACEAAPGIGTSEKRRRLWVGVVAGLAIAFHPVLLQGASSGMEVSLSAACLLLFLWADLAQKQTLCLGMAALLPLVRPEFLACTISYSVIRALQVRSWRPLLIVSCSLAGMATWVAYSYVATGYPLPNTYYVKSGNGVATGLSYLSNTWAVSEPWLVSLGGAALLAFAMFETRRQYRSAFWAMGAMWLSSLLAIAASRPLHNGILFFELRYFAPLAVLPPIALAQGLLCIRRRWLGPLLLVPMVALAVFQLPDSYRLNRMQEGNIRRLHREPAQRIARELPSDSVVAVEGAGAARFFTPRSMRVVDVLGLNNRVIAHGPSDVVKLCAVLLQEPDYFLLPDNFVRSFSELFELESRWVAIEPSYAQGRRIGIFRVHLFASAGPTKLLTRECSALRGETP